MNVSQQGLQSDIIGITMGCPVGIGPEIILRFLSDFGQKSGFLPVVLGDLGVLKRCGRELGLGLELAPWFPGEKPQPRRVNVFSLSELSEGLAWGEPTAETGKAMGGYIEKAVRLVRSGALAAMVTCPITKTALQAGGYHYPGHTEMLAALCGASEYAMMMAGAKLRVSLVTIHAPLTHVAASITEEAVGRLIAITYGALQRDFGIGVPRLAVAGLNPHAGEGGMFGREEEEAVLPAVHAAQAKGWQVSGPFPPDTVFNKAVAGDFDAVVCMYHDQGLIPFKLMHFRDGVNVTLGLPIVRTSVDHGTAYDIAGQGLADPASLAAAFSLAGEIVMNRGRTD